MDAMADKIAAEKPKDAAQDAMDAFDQDKSIKDVAAAEAAEKEFKANMSR